MKFVVPSLQLGEMIKGRVEEILGDGALIINIAGDLLQVQNQTHLPLQVGSSVTLVVKAVLPLRFQLVDDRSVQKRKGKIDIAI